MKTITDLIVRKEILFVAGVLKMDISDETIDRVLQEYDDYRAQYPNELWSEIVEIMLNDYKHWNDQNPSKVRNSEHQKYGEDDSTDHRFFNYEDDIPPLNHFHSDGDGDDDTLLNFNK